MRIIIMRDEQLLFRMNFIVQDEKLAIDDEKTAFEKLKLAIESCAYNEPTKNNIIKLYEEIETNQVFGAPEVENILKCSTSTSKNIMKN